MDEFRPACLFTNTEPVFMKIHLNVLDTFLGPEVSHSFTFGIRRTKAPS
jgi:hypothetical protein